MSRLDLCKTYLQIRVSESPWLFKTVMFNGIRYFLTRLGFSCNVAPQIIKTLISVVLAQEKTIEKATSAYLDDIYINKDIVLLMSIWAKLVQFGLVCKNQERLKNGTQVLDLKIWKKQSKLVWRWRTAILDIPDVITC